MEIVILALLGVLILGAVVAPLFRGRDRYQDEAEYAVQPTSAAARPAPAPSVASATAAGDEAGVVSEEQQAAAAAADVALDDELENEVARYREAIKAGTLCSRCGEANPVDARFCRDCGKALPASDAQEFAL